MSFLIKIGALDHLRDVSTNKTKANKAWHEGYLCALADIGAITEEEYEDLMNQLLSYLYA